MATTKNITMKQFNGTDYDTLYPKTVYNQVSGVAPAGYGLGGIGKRVTDMNNAQESGFYSALGASNLPPNVESVQYGSVLVLCSQKDRVTQIYFQDVTNGTGAIAVRRLNGNGWSQWEFINPPMELGVEYRTTERYQGKPVYVKLVDCGALPNSASKSISISDDTTVRCLDVLTGTNSSGMVLPTACFGGLNLNREVAITANGNSIYIVTNFDGSSYTKTYVLVKYYKTTD